MDRQYPIAYIGEEFGYAERNGIVWDGEVDAGMVASGYVDLVHVTVLKVSKNHFTDEYVYKIRKDYFTGRVEEQWCSEIKIHVMKGGKIG